MQKQKQQILSGSRLKFQPLGLKLKDYCANELTVAILVHFKHTHFISFLFNDHLETRLVKLGG